jgi:hypothetical protein
MTYTPLTTVVQDGSAMKVTVTMVVISITHALATDVVIWQVVVTGAVKSGLPDGCCGGTTHFHHGSTGDGCGC